MKIQIAKGFTLIELLIVVAIIAILAAIAVPNFLEAQVRSKVARTMTDMRTEALALEAYTVDYNVAPLDSEPTFPNVNPFADFPNGASATSYWPGVRTDAGQNKFLNPGEAHTVVIGGTNTKTISWWEKALTTPVSYLSGQIRDVFHDRVWITSKNKPNYDLDTFYSWVTIGGNFLYRNYEHNAKAYCLVNGGPPPDSYKGDLSGTVGYTPSYYIYALGGYRWALFSAGPSYRGSRYQLCGNGGSNLPIISTPGFPTYDPTNGTKSIGYIARTNKGVYTIGTRTDYQWTFAFNNAISLGIP